jgi:hypothetical protein
MSQDPSLNNMSFFQKIQEERNKNIQKIQAEEEKRKLDQESARNQEIQRIKQEDVPLHIQNVIFNVEKHIESFSKGEQNFSIPGFIYFIPYTDEEEEELCDSVVKQVNIELHKKYQMHIRTIVKMRDSCFRQKDYKFVLEPCTDNSSCML